MFSTKGPGVAGASRIAVGIVVATILVAPIASAETIMTINGKKMDSAVLDIYMRGRVQKPVEQVTPEERAALIDELADLYVLSTVELADKLAKEPEVAAQIDLQTMSVVARAVAIKLAESIEVSEAEIQSTYDQQIKLAPTQQYNARHILVKTQGEAVAIIEQLIAGGNFEELAKEHSLDSSASTGGDLGWFTPNQMVRPLAETVVRLGDGRYTTDPVQTEYGWHVIKRVGVRAAEPPPLEGVRENIEAAVQQQKLRDKIDQLKSESIK